MVRKTLVLLSLVALSGCAPTLVGANQAGGMVGNVRMEGLLSNTADAFNLANAQCQRYGKVAQMNARLSGVNASSGTLSFDCVAP
ncbi:MAG: hypothetical protein ACREAC_15050 [Blastocatellia bacterium]